MSTLDFALAYAAIGWHVFPLLKGTKRPNGKLAPRGHLDATVDVDKITAWWAADADSGIGIAVKPSRLVVVDVDPRNGGHFDMERIEAEHGKLETDVLAYTGGGGLHLVFLAPDDEGKKLPGKLARGIDLKSDGYIAVEPTFAPLAEPAHLKPYAWEASSNPLEENVPSPLPGWIADMGHAAAALHAGPGGVATGPAPMQRTEAEMAEIRHALGCIPSDERETWVAVGMALHKDVGGALGFELWCEWSKTCAEKFDPQDQQRVWRSFTRKPMGQAVQLGTVFDLAYKHGFSRPAAPMPAQAVMQHAPAGTPDPRTLNTVPELVSGPQVQLQAFPIQGLNDLARWIYDSTPNAHGLLAQATALALACACAGRRYVSEYGDPAQAFFGLLTPTASQARPMMTAAESALITIELRRLVRSQRMGSAQQVYASFVRSDSVLYAADDWGDQLTQAKRQPSGLLSIAHGVLAGRVHSGKDIALDSWADLGLRARPEDVDGPSEGAEKHMPTLYRPALTLLAAIAEPTLRSVFKRAEFGRGALDCMLFVPALSLDGWADRNVASHVALPANVYGRLREMQGLPADPAQERDRKPDSVLLRPTPIVVRFACNLAAVETRWIEHGRQLAPQLRPLSWGARATMRRICVAMAAFNDPVAPVVTPDMLDFVERVVRQCLDVTLAEVALLGDDEDAKPDAASFLLEAIVRRGPEGMPQRDLHKYCKAYKRLNSDDRLQVLGQLYGDKEITDMPSACGRGKVIVASQFVVERPWAPAGDLGDRETAPVSHSGDRPHL